MALIIGVDPGKQGGIVPLNRHGDPQAAIPMPQISGERGGRTGVIDWPYLRLFFSALQHNGKWIVALEALAEVTGGMAGRGKSMGTMIGEFHLLREAIDAANLQIREIRSQTWQAAYGLNKYLPQPDIPRNAMTDKQKQAHTRLRRMEREERMFQWANNEWPWASERFTGAWNSGTVAAAMIGRHLYSELIRDK